jgi:hypothetical protein
LNGDEDAVGNLKTDIANEAANKVHPVALEKYTDRRGINIHTIAIFVADMKSLSELKEVGILSGDDKEEFGKRIFAANNPRSK